MGLLFTPLANRKCSESALEKKLEINDEHETNKRFESSGSIDFYYCSLKNPA